MEQDFIAILQQLVAEQGKEALNASNRKALLADYTKNEYKKESRFLLNALEAGVQKAIDASTELPLCKKQQIRLLHEDYGLTEEIAAGVVDALALVLRGDASKSKAEAPPETIEKKAKPTATQKTPERAAPNIPAASQIKPPLTPKIIPFGGYDWRILDEQNGKALILSEKIIEKRAYHSSYSDITWENCTLRSYLNGEFYNSFSPKDRLRIAGGIATTDRIFLLSIDEVQRYLSGDNARIAKDASGTASWWWLRSPGRYGDFAAIVDDDGGLGVNGGVDRDDGGVRPALWLNL